MQTGKIGVTSDNIFPIIKKFLYSDHEIFLRELVSNAIDATQKLKALASKGEFKGELGDLTVRVNLDEENNKLIISDRGIGMTAEEIDKYINQIAFSSAGDFLEKYKDKIDAIIGHFGLGFYSSFMVADKVEIITKSYQEGAKAAKWSCDGSPEYSIDEIEKEDRGTDIVLYLGEEGKDFNSKSKIQELLDKYCKFLPIEIAFGKEQEWKDDKYVDTDKDKIINDVNPAWTQKPTDLKEEDYNKFYRKLYPAAEEPMFNIHLNVDYPFNLTGILYFPKIKNNIEIQKNKIQLYCNQVFVTDSVEGIVPDFLTLLHGVLDSPDIPLNVSRSYLQSDSNVKKISNHITKKVADRLNEIFKTDRPEFEKKWDNIKLFIQYGMLTDEKFYDRAKKFFLLKNIDGKFFTFEEYENIIKENQTDKDKKVVYIYATDVEGQHSFINAAKDKGYDVLLMDGQLDTHLLNSLESKLPNSKFVRVDADIVDNLVQKEDAKEISLSQEQIDALKPVFEGQLPTKDNYFVVFEGMKSDLPAIVTQAEFMRRMKEMAASGGAGGFYADLPASYNLVVNANHELIQKIQQQKDQAVGAEVEAAKNELKPLKEELTKIEEAQKDKKDEEIPQADKDKKQEVEGKIREQEDKVKSILMEYGKTNKLVKQVIDLALLANNMLKGEDLTKFVKRSVELIEK